jgi:hypothetical protein
MYSGDEVPPACQDEFLEVHGIESSHEHPTCVVQLTAKVSKYVIDGSAGFLSADVELGGAECPPSCINAIAEIFPVGGPGDVLKPVALLGGENAHHTLVQLADAEGD